jgi:glycosyltransferase involved in cell wall biosynthesis
VFPSLHTSPENPPGIGLPNISTNSENDLTFTGRSDGPLAVLPITQSPTLSFCLGNSELSISEIVIFFGKSSEIDAILCYSDLFLLPSSTESFGLAALEAMACGVPVISSNSGGLPEVNKHGYSGYLSNVGDVHEMASNAIKILSDEATLNQFKKNALENANQFDIQNILPLYEDLYQKVVNEKVLL